ncbi:Fic family protein [Streptomyces sp. RG80]|uniref:Fic family protein n=1 Tax=Streptomyces sp. RG80 TaxID=3157340 RepID=UPI00338DD17E
MTRARAAQPTADTPAPQHPTETLTAQPTAGALTAPRPTDTPTAQRPAEAPPARPTAGTPTGQPAPDHLRGWLDLRARIRWHRARTAPAPVTPTRDGAAHDIRAHDHARSPQRAARLLDALALARADAVSAVPLTFGLLGTWQRHVLGGAEAPPFRGDPAYAKSGRERYGTGPDLPARLDACLAEACDPALPLTARAARAYLDVCFFHPFDDGNARSAFLTLTFVLAREGVGLDQVGPVRRIRRRADDPEGALALADLLAVLITAAAGRPAPGGPGCRPSPAWSGPRPPRGRA